MGHTPKYLTLNERQAAVGHASVGALLTCPMPGATDDSDDVSPAVLPRC